ncbi:hypothetical protein HQN89_32885 [Paenibacillus frigoriresistens]|nr:hypothetical protein [Paenibacillus frigoriresistens]
MESDNGGEDNDSLLPIYYHGFLVTLNSVYKLLKAHQERHVPNGNTLVDGLVIGDVSHIVLLDRKVLSEDDIIDHHITTRGRNEPIGALLHHF